ncbi:N-acetylglutamate synthase [Candidatus Tenderia electrophaga]|uniref:Amino-acid acetyltransferase n=1 Tax=Candidatus Tenderia electrophaga TaxID=1748243 RepID=A0A0S2TB39_9GAMM|nr:N-acetylglutamate synthase [Candidatus Tenderia electrophaga]
MSSVADGNKQAFIHWFRQSSPYIHAFRGRTFVLAFDGAAVADCNFHSLVHDIALLNSLGIRLVLVHGARPQIEQRVNQQGAQIDYVNGLRITDDIALACVKQAVGSVRVEIEAQLSMGVANSPMAGARIRVASGNYVTAQPLGVRDGVDYCHTGQVRRIDATAIQQRLDDGAIVLASPLGYSPTGETFNLTANEVATAIAVALQADKLMFLTEGDGIHDAEQRLMRELNTEQAQQLLQRQQISDDELAYLRHAVQACRRGVTRTHLIDRRIDGCLLQELFTRDGIGTLITAGQFEATRQANIDDVGGILSLIKPLEESGVLVRRSREQLELEIDHFIVVERDGTVVACAALYPYTDEQVAELACLAVHPDYRKANRGGELLAYTEKVAKARNIERMFVLTTQTAHWFQERGYAAGDIDNLPVQRKSLYNYQRRSKVFIKQLGA